MHLRSFLLLATPLFLHLVGCGSSDSTDTDTSHPGTDTGGQGGAGAGGQGGAAGQGGAGGKAGAGAGGIGGMNHCTVTYTRCVNGMEQTGSCDPCSSPNSVDCDMPDGHVSCGDGTCVNHGQTCGKGGQGGGGAGGTAQGGAGQGGTAQGGAGAGGQSGSIEGSFDLHFGTVTAEQPITGEPPISQGTSARIDIRKTADGAGYEALFTSTFLTPLGMTVAVTADKVTLTGEGLVKNNFAQDSWETLALGRNAAGGLDGTVSGKGQEQVSGGDVISNTAIAGTGTIGVDVTAPSYASKPFSYHGPSDALLPWDPVVLQVSEGLGSEALAKALTLSIDIATSADPQLTFDPAPDAPLGWGGSTRVEVRASSWDGPMTTPDVPENTFGLTVAAGVPDRVGNPGPSFEVKAKRLPVALAGKSLGFDGDVLEVSPWGAVVPLGADSGSDPHCEKGGCLQLGPFGLGYCSQDVLGFAGRSPFAGESTLSVRYRLFVKGDAGVAPSIIGPSLFVDVYALSGQVASVSPAAGSESLSDQGAAAGELRWATGWLTLDVAIPAGTKASELGFVIAAGSSPSCGFVPPAIQAEIYVDSVTLH
jgi:hypothetical protein